MTTSTIEIVKSALKADPSVLPTDRAKILSLIRNANAERTEPESRVPRILKRAEVAKRLAVCPRTIDNLAKIGALKRRILPGRVRSVGFLESDVLGLITA